MTLLRSKQRFTSAVALLLLLFALHPVRAQVVVERVAADVTERVTPEAIDRAIAEDAKETADATAKTDVEKIIAAGRDNNQAMAHLDYLSNRIGPRLTSSDGLTTACEWTREKFESLGLANSHLEKWAEWPVGFNRGPWSGRMVTPEPWALEFATDAWTAGTKGKQRGPAIIAPTNDEELAANKDKLKGAWLLTGSAGGRQGGGGGRGRRGAGERGDGQPANTSANDGQRTEAQTADSARGGREQDPQVPEQPAQPQPTEGQPAAAERAAAQPEAQPTQGQPAEGQAAEGQAANEQPGRGRRGGNRGAGRRGFNDPFRQRLQTAAREAGALGMITRRDAELIVSTGRRPTSMDFFDNLPTIPQITMTASSYDAIANNVREGKEVMLEFDIRNYFKKGPIPLYNVVADIPGSEHPDECVIVCGHLDSWDAGTGTTDNGTGCATTIEAARILMTAGVRPKRTIRFILWSGEEQGILGSRAYVEANSELMKKVSGVLNHDVGTQYISSIKTLPYQRSDMEQIFAPVMKLNAEFPFRLEPVDSLVGLGSDHASFNRVGVPGFIWGQSGELATYRDTHHTQLDTYDRAVPAYQEHSSIVVALAAYGIANLDHMLARAGDDETED